MMIGRNDCTQCRCFTRSSFRLVVERKGGKWERNSHWVFLRVRWQLLSCTRRRCSYCHHFVDVETEVQRSKIKYKGHLGIGTALIATKQLCLKVFILNHFTCGFQSFKKWSPGRRYLYITSPYIWLMYVSYMYTYIKWKSHNYNFHCI